MTIRLDRNIYSENCITKVVYWFSDKYTINRLLDGHEEVLSIEGVKNDAAFQHDFFEKLNDYKLREQIEQETKDIRTILYAKAFGEFDELTEDELAE